jgi:DNA-binding XRE family transcriptional regulator
MTDNEFSPSECRQARQGLNWTRDQLADAAKVGKRTIIDFENGVRQPVSATKAALKNALTSAGVEFQGERITIPVLPS